MKDAYSIIFKRVEVKVEKETKGLSLHADLYGENINREKHELRNDIKAITLHMFKIEKTEEGFKTVFVVDV